MKKLFLCSLPLALMGCVQSHQSPPVVYSRVPAVVTPAPAVVVEPPVVATSPRSVERVYPPADGVRGTDLEIAGAVRSVMREEAFVPLVENNVQARVENGVVTLTGTVPTVRERDELVTLIAKIPGVVQVRDRTTID